MTRITTNAYDLIGTKFQEKRRRWREENAKDFFKMVHRRQGREEASIVVDNVFGKRLHEHLGLGSARFVSLLKTALATHSREDLTPITYVQYRQFLSLLVQRVKFARDQMRLRLVFKEVAGRADFIAKEDVGRIAQVMGSSDLDTHDLRVLARHSDPANGKLHRDKFLIAMFRVALEAKVRALLLEKKAKNETIFEAFYDRAKFPQHGSYGKEPYLNLRGFKAASIELGLAWSTKLIRGIKHASGESIQTRGSRMYHGILEMLETGIWSWLVALPLVLFALFGGPIAHHISSFELVVPLLLSAEVLLRLGCYLGLGRPPWEFFGHNVPEAVASALDIAFVVAVASGELPLDARRAARGMRFARLAYLAPVVESLVPRSVSRWILCRRSSGSTDTSISAAGFHVTFEEFRRYFSCSKADEVRERPVWPINIYRRAFLQFDEVHGSHSGAVELDDLPELVHATGHWPTEYELTKMRQVLSVPSSGVRKRSDNTAAPAVFFFDDFTSAMTLLRDERVESQLLACFESTEKRCWRTFMYTAKRGLIALPAALAAFVGAILKLATNLYVLAQATFGNDVVELKLASYMEALVAVSVLLQSNLQWLVPPLLLIAFVIRAAFHFLVAVGSLFQFNFTDVPSGVDCTGVLSLMYYPVILLIIAFVVVLFDSATYVFLKVSPSDYRHFVSTYLHQFLPKRELARIFEHYSIQGVVMIMERGLKNLMQIVIANLVFSKFLPFWSSISHACQVGYAYTQPPKSIHPNSTLASLAH